MFRNPVTKVIDSLKKHLGQLHSSKEDERLKAKTKLSGDIFQIHFYLYGDADNDPRSDLIENLVTRLLNVEDDLFLKFAQNIQLFDFEAKKHTAGIMNYIIRRCSKNNVHKYIKSKTNQQTHNNLIVDCLLSGYHDQHLAQNVGSVLQEMAKRNEIAPHLLELQVTQTPQALIDVQNTLQLQQQQLLQNNNNNNSNSKSSLNKPQNTTTATTTDATQTQAEAQSKSKSQSPKNTNDSTTTSSNSNSNPSSDEYKTDNSAAVAAMGGNGNWDIVDELFVLVKKPSFDIASDAYKTLHLLLTRNKKRVAVWLESNYERFAMKFNLLIQSENYVTQRQFLALLSEILMEKANFKIMIKYIGDKLNLKIAMTLIKNDSKAISHEAFHIFKIFVANPKKTRDIQIILYKNQDKLIQFLQTFLPEKSLEDQQFADEKDQCIKHLRNMPMPAEIEEHLKKKRERAKSRAASAEAAAAAVAIATASATATEIDDETDGNNNNKEKVEDNNENGGGCGDGNEEIETEDTETQHVTVVAVEIAENNSNNNNDTETEIAVADETEVSTEPQNTTN